LWSVCLVAGSIAGFFAGRHTVEQPESVRYVRETPVTGTVERIEPIKIEIPPVPVLLTRTDTVYIDSIVYTREVVDTAAIIADYELKRSYAVPLFDNQYGRLNLSLSTQYNRLGSLSYEFTPLTKTVYREKIWRPFASASFSSFGYAGAGAGVFYRCIGIEYQLQTTGRHIGHGVEIKYLFQ
jgi:hypothetical protein